MKLPWLRVLTAFAVSLTPLAAFAAPLPISAGLVLNFQSYNIDGQKNATLVDGQDLPQWNDLLEPGGDPNANHATHSGGKNYLDSANANTLMPNYVAVTASGVPGIQFTRVSGVSGDALGRNSTIDGLTTTGGFTAFVVGDFANPGPARSFQLGNRGGNNNSVVGLGNRGFRFNANEKTFTTAFDQLTATQPTIATYTMEFAQAYGADGVNARYRLDGVEALTTTANTGPATTLGANFLNHGFAIGAGQSNASAVIDSISGTMYAIIVYNRVLSSQEILDVESYLGRYVPEPSSYALMGVAAAFCGWLGATRRRVAQT